MGGRFLPLLHTPLPSSPPLVDLDRKLLGGRHQPLCGMRSPCALMTTRYRQRGNPCLLHTSHSLPHRLCTKELPGGFFPPFLHAHSQFRLFLRHAVCNFCEAAAKTKVEELGGACLLRSSSHCLLPDKSVQTCSGSVQACAHLLRSKSPLWSEAAYSQVRTSRIAAFKWPQAH